MIGQIMLCPWLSLACPPPHTKACTIKRSFIIAPLTGVSLCVVASPSTVMCAVTTEARLEQCSIEYSPCDYAYLTARMGFARPNMPVSDCQPVVEELFKLRDCSLVRWTLVARVNYLQFSSSTLLAGQLSELRSSKIDTVTSHLFLQIMMGVHGIGLTSLVWMKLTPR